MSEEFVANGTFHIVACSLENYLLIGALRAFDLKEYASGFGDQFPPQCLGSDLQLSQPDSEPLDRIITVLTLEFEKRLLRCLGSAL